MPLLKVLNMNQTKQSERASDYRGASDKQPTDRNTSNVSNENDGSEIRRPLSFSNTVKASLFPKKDQAIIYPAIDGLQVKDYVIETGKLVEPKNILFASRMSNGRICIYFSSKEVVNRFIEKEGGLTINDMFIQARKLIMPAKRIIVSNVSPCIPHHVLEEKLKQENIKVVSPVSFIGAGIGLDQYKHVLSFRRQFFVAEETAASVPSSLLIKFDDEEYRIFLTDDQMRCFRCREIGHVAARCTRADNETVIIPVRPENRGKRPPPSPSNTTEDDVFNLSQEPENDSGTEDNVSITEVDESQLIVPDAEGVMPTNEPRNDIFRQPTKLPKAKRIRVDRPSTDEEDGQDNLQEVEELWKKDNDYPIDFINFSEFMNKVKGSEKPAEIARRYTQDLEGLITVIKDARVLISRRATKQRCRRLIEALVKVLNKEGNNISCPLGRSSSQESVRSDRSSY